MSIFNVGLKIVYVAVDTEGAVGSVTDVRTQRIVKSRASKFWSAPLAVTCTTLKV